METNYEKIGLKLRKAREYMGLTQEQVANILNLGRDAILRIEKGTRKIDAEELKKLSQLYKISMNEIMEDKEYTSNSQAFARGFEELSEKDKKEILDLIKFKNEFKKREL